MRKASRARILVKLVLGTILQQLNTDNTPQTDSSDTMIRLSTFNKNTGRRGNSEKTRKSLACKDTPESGEMSEPTGNMSSRF